MLTGAFSYSFISYAAHTILPSLAVAAAVYPVLAFILFTSRSLVPREINVVELQHSVSEPSSSTGDAHVRHAPGDLNDKRGAIFGSVLLGITLGVLIGTSPLKIPVWQVTVPPALIMLARDIWHDRDRWRRSTPAQRPDDVEAEGGSQEEAIELDASPRSDTSAAAGNETRNEKGHSTLLSYIQNIKEDTLPTVMSIIPRLPLSLVLFAFCMFILVQALTTWGWVEVFAGWWAAWIRVCTRNGVGSATVGAIGGMLVISTLLCNVRILFISADVFLAILISPSYEDLRNEHRNYYPPCASPPILA